MINQTLIIYPLFVQILLTAIVWLWMYKTRFSEMRRLKIHPQAIARSAELSDKLKLVSGPSENLSNLFEVPVLFYVLLISIFITQHVDVLFLVLASSYVALRYVHSFIHCTSNKVTLRFFAYFLSTMLLWATWALFVLKIINN